MARLFKPQKKKKNEPLIHESSIIQKIRMSKDAFRKQRMLILYFFFSLFLLVAGALNLPIILGTQGLFMDFLSPILKLTSQPISVLDEWGQKITDFFNTPSKLRNLRNENENLKKYFLAFTELQEENQNLKKLLNIKEIIKKPFLTARVISYPSQPHSQSIIIDGGKNHGAQVDQVAITEKGLIGRVIQVGAYTAQVVLITDINSRIPVIIESKNISAIFMGNNQNMPFLKYVTDKADVALGDKVLTSGKGGIFKAGIPVGYISSIKDGTISVTPVVALDHLSFVSLLPRLPEIY